MTLPVPITSRKFSMGDRVTKIKGSRWTGTVCGFYSSSMTPDGYCVESELEVGSVQIYPAQALTLLPPSDAGEAHRCEVETLHAEIHHFKEAICLPDAERRQRRLSELLDARGFFNRSDLCREFGISTAQASHDICRFLTRHPKAAFYNPSAKRYERL